MGLRPLLLLVLHLLVINPSGFADREIMLCHLLIISSKRKARCC